RSKSAAVHPLRGAHPADVRVRRSAGFAEPRSGRLHGLRLDAGPRDPELLGPPGRETVEPAYDPRASALVPGRCVMSASGSFYFFLSYAEVPPVPRVPAPEPAARDPLVDTFFADL